MVFYSFGGSDKQIVVSKRGRQRMLLRSQRSQIFQNPLLKVYTLSQNKDP